MTAPKAASQNRYGERYYGIPEPGGTDLIELPGASAFGKLLAAPGLEVWKLKAVARQLAHKPDLLLLAGSEDTLWDAIRQAQDADKSAANTGTAVHSYTQQYDEGTLIAETVPYGARPYLEQYELASLSHNWVVLAAEQTVYNFEHAYAGTFDRIYNLPDIGIVVGDLKTGKGPYPDMSLQLAALANAEGIWQPPDNLPETQAAIADLGAQMHATKMTQKAVKEAQTAIEYLRAVETARLGRHMPLPEGLRRDVGLVVMLHEDECVLHLLNLGEAWQAVKALSVVRRWQSSTIVGPPLQPEGTARAHDPARPSLPVADGSLADSQTRQPPPAAPDPGDVRPVSTDAPQPLVDSAAGQPDLQLDGRREKTAEHIRWLNTAQRGALLDHWPPGVPGFKDQPWLHTAEQLDAVQRVILAVEQSTDRYMPFEQGAPTSQAEAVELVTHVFVPPDYANAERQPLIDRVTALPADLLPLVTNRAKELDIPNLRSTQLTKQHAATMSAILDSAEQIAADAASQQGALV